MIFDTHAHYDDTAFNEDRYDLLEKILSGTVSNIVNQGTDVKTSQFSIDLAERFDGIYAATGLHPEYLKEVSESDIEEIRRLAKHPKAVAIGEIGLDYYYDTPADIQKEVFRRMLELAQELDMPVNIHDREAHGDMMDFMRKYRPEGIMHCFSGSAEMAAELVRLGMYIGIGGVITFKNARKAVEVVSAVPHDRLVLETDCPYLAPVPFRGKRNDSSYIAYTAQKVAEIWEVSAEEVIRQTAENAKTVYKIK